jgi:hypothetical protein
MDNLFVATWCRICVTSLETVSRVTDSLRLLLGLIDSPLV